MAIVGQRFSDSVLLHDPKRSAIRQAPALVGSFAIERERIAELAPRLSDYGDVTVRCCALDQSGCKPAQEFTPLTEVVQELGEHHLAGHEALRWK